MNTVTRFTLAAVAALLSLPTMAATVSLDPSSLLVDPNGTFTVDVVMDASDAPGAHPGVIQGNFKITFDDSLAQYDGFSYVDSIELLPLSVAAGSVTVGFTNGDEIGTIGTLSFTATANVGDVINIGVGNAFGVTAENPDGISTFVNLLPANTGFEPEFAPTSINVVPIPAAAWMMFSALGVLGGWARRKN